MEGFLQIVDESLPRWSKWVNQKQDRFLSKRAMYSTETVENRAVLPEIFQTVNTYQWQSRLSNHCTSVRPATDHRLIFYNVGQAYPWKTMELRERGRLTRVSCFSLNFPGRLIIVTRSLSVEDRLVLHIEGVNLLNDLVSWHRSWGLESRI